jgi:sterol desaturase/sphingolipid hydroxylase (fatty acid hydroxylase superfamily)
VGALNRILDFFQTTPPLQAFAWMLLENAVLLFVTLLLGAAIIRLFVDRRVTPAPPPVTRHEILLATLCVLMNTVVTIAGWWLWRHGYIALGRQAGWRVLGDALVLLMAMDLGMYVTHRMAHWPPIFKLLHSAHHRYDHPRPLNLFVLHPGEVLGFGALWLGIMCLYPASWIGTCIYLTLNLLFGTIGHVGVEPFHRSWARLLFLRQIGTSTFHAEHHLRRQYNFGFYTLFWDRLFGTLDPQYQQQFESAGAR